MKALLRSTVVALLLFGAYAAYSTTGPNVVPSPAPQVPRPNCPW